MEGLTFTGNYGEKNLVLLLTNFAHYENDKRERGGSKSIDFKYL